MDVFTVLSAFVIDRKVWKKFFFRSEQIERYWLDKQQLKVLEGLFKKPSKSISKVT